MSCKDCLWEGMCYSSIYCEFYTPFEEDVDAAVNEARFEYREAFFVYEDEDDS